MNGEIILLREQLRKMIRYLGVLEKSDSQENGITIAQCHALVEIGRAGKISLNPLADLLMVEKSSMSRMIQNLVKAKLVERGLDLDDKRSVVIQLSPKGQELFGQIETEMGRYYQAIYHDIPIGKRSQVVESLEILTGAISKQSKETR